MNINARIKVPDAVLAAFCQKWKITQLEAFGSVLREDFGPDSDIDLLVTFEPNSRTTLFNLVEMERELAGIVGRPVELISRRGVEQSKNYIRRKSILGSARTVFSRA